MVNCLRSLSSSSLAAAGSTISFSVELDMNTVQNPGVSPLSSSLSVMRRRKAVQGPQLDEKIRRCWCHPVHRFNPPTGFLLKKTTCIKTGRRAVTTMPSMRAEAGMERIASAMAMSGQANAVATGDGAGEAIKTVERKRNNISQKSSSSTALLPPQSKASMGGHTWHGLGTNTSAAIAEMRKVASKKKLMTQESAYNIYF